MTAPLFSLVKTANHELHVTEWGDPENSPLVMWHGLARTGRDFDELAAALSDEYFVICPDTIGRGLSSWAPKSETAYRINTYADHAVALLDHYQMDRAAWVGTSMGGLIGMHLAAGASADRLSCLVINDIGPEVPQAAVDRIIRYAADLPEFDQLSEAEAWLRNTYAPFGPADDAFWRRMTRSSVRRTGQGRFTLHYDPEIIQQFAAYLDDLSTWDNYKKIKLPCHVIRGENSDLLTPDILARMQQEGPKPGATEFAGCGHAPTLSRKADIQLVRGLLKDLQLD
ncbi:alpha/beta fold hydrolase [Parasedimentitalea huanghaiensis]|uniref:Alpha/beta fold hydrolase n=1 Tax=Parasedimentitalea huanghaiensis TaxID=2682100 RepID=A0A6L6WSA1_9RHOB|nr:alpha/beta hydrolase [Zongyanglinia huanghaiensis]MVO18412.1 alpha/beta fold hydrolase [Zongyanglinia huanghaiensis]